MSTPDQLPPDPHLAALLAEAGWVLDLAKRLARDQATAQDIAQSTLALALERRPSVDAGLRPWLAKVAGTLARRTLRSDARRRNREVRAIPLHGQQSSASDEALMRFEQQQDLARRVDALPEPYRRVLILRYYEGLSVKQITKATKAPAGTVRSQLTRGLERLRLQYDHDSGALGALGAFLLAAGSRPGPSARRAAEIISMQTSTKLALTATAVLAAIFVQPYLGRSDPLEEAHLSQALSSSEELREASPRKTPVANTDVEAVERTAQRSVPLKTDRSSPTEVTQPKPVSTLRARILDRDRNPLEGAILRPVQRDGRIQVTALGRSEPNGTVLLELPDSALRAWRGQPLEMIFAAGAAGHATEFLTLKPRLHEETQLGDILLGPGGALVGICVGSDGQPLPGATLNVGPSTISQDPDLIRFTGPNSNVTRLMTVSADDGSFELRGIPASVTSDGSVNVRLWAHAPGSFWTSTGPYTITAGSSRDVGRIRLEEVPSELRIDGVAFGPSGLPLADARIHYLSPDGPQSGSVVADAHGRFTVVPRDATALELVGRDDANELGMSPALRARRGERVELQLLPRRVLAILVTDTEGHPVHDAGVLPNLLDELTPLEEGGRLLPSEEWSYSDAEGRLTMVVPAQRFGIFAKKRGFESLQLGPFEYDTAPETLRILLPRGPEASGRVLAYGEPVVGARVVAGKRYPMVTMTDGLVNRFTTSGGSSTTTDAHGRFTLALEPGATSVPLVAALDGWASGEVQVDLLPGEDADGIVLALTQGGVIEGKVIPPPGMESSALHVAASRGDGRPLSTRVDEQGDYRFEGLTPGAWRVEGRLREVSAEMQFVARHPEDAEPGWNVVVADRSKATFEVDMRHLGNVELVGQLRIDGSAPLSGWRVEVVPPFHERWHAETPAMELDSDGRFALTVRPGRAELRLFGPVPGGASIEMLRPLRLHGPRFDWQETLWTASVAEQLEGRPKRARFVQGVESEGKRELTIVPVDADGSLSARVPTGHSSLQVPAPDPARPDEWQTVRTLEVK